MLWLILIHIHTRYSCRKSVNGNYSVMRLIVNLIVVLTQWLSGAPEASQYPQIGFCDLAVAVAEHYTACSVCIKYIYTIHIHIHTYIYIYQWHTYIPWPHPQKQRFEIQKIITPSAVIFFFNFRVIIRPPWVSKPPFSNGIHNEAYDLPPTHPPFAGRWVAKGSSGTNATSGGHNSAAGENAQVSGRAWASKVAKAMGSSRQPTTFPKSRPQKRAKYLFGPFCIYWNPNPGELLLV